MALNTNVIPSGLISGLTFFYNPTIPSGLDLLMS